MLGETMIDNFYYRLNQSHKGLDNDDYIKITTEVMNTVFTNQQTKSTLLIIGAGNLSDFDLSFFLSKFNNVCLSDIDAKSIKYALGENINNPKIKVKQIDYIGIEETNFYDDFDALLKMNDYYEMTRFIESKMERIKAYQFSKKFNQQFDTIYISPIYTQLFYREVEVKLTSLVDKGFSEIYKQKILLILLQSMVDIIDLFNNEIVKLLMKNGTVFVGSDIFFLKQDRFSNKVRKVIDNNESIEEIYREYNDKYDFGLGDYGLYSLSEKLKTTSEKWALWGRGEHDAYAVKFKVMKKS